ncbi:MAG: DUF1549 and DUF1553 domain-containing protein [Gemmataceae bacterium]|nr:DUF1549 and DUF1553 domain-containing protein [Gemmataceae bacterium]
MLVLLLLAADPLAKHDAAVKPEHRAHWAYRPVKRPVPPPVKDASWPITPIDRFILARLEEKGKKPSPQASPAILRRRLSLALAGLPPTLAEQEREERYEAMAERLLASPAYGERWGRHWLDVARYADTNGYERDGDKPSAWRYRDRVVRAMNADLPYDRFVLEQLAGDELPDADAASVIATGFLRLGPWDDEPPDPANDRFDQLDDTLSASCEAFLGLTLACARCHDHKFEPFSQADYYRVMAVFAPLDRPRDGRLEQDRPAVPAARRAEVRAMLDKVRSLEQSAKLAEPGSARLFRQEAEAIKKKLAAFPRGYFFEEGPTVPKTHLLRRGRASLAGPEVPPGLPAVLVDKQPDAPKAMPGSSGRRLAFARWIADAKNPLTARVMANRLWAWHFGTGLVDTPSDFGTRGGTPSHPELLDWLAAELVESGWSLKHMHRLIVASATYRQKSSKADPLLAGFPYRRLEAEAIRDSILAVSGQLDRKMGGHGVKPPIPAAALEGHPDAKTVWKAGTEAETSRRTVYVHVKRSLLVPVVEALDFCDTARSAPRRPVTTVAPQALMLYNGGLVNGQARHLAARLEREASSVEDRVKLAYRLLLSRLPDKEESAVVSAFIGKNGLAQACRVLLNLNEFVYPD